MHTTRKGRTEGDDDKSGLGGGRITHTGGVEKKRVPLSVVPQSADRPRFPTRNWASADAPSHDDVILPSNIAFPIKSRSGIGWLGGGGDQHIIPTHRFLFYRINARNFYHLFFHITTVR